jgi:predicted  nucleic acid-binding Zn-ribbon protein
MTEPVLVLGQIQDLTKSLDTASKELYRVEREADQVAEAFEDVQVEWDESFEDRLIAFVEPYTENGIIKRIPGEDVRNAFITNAIREQDPELYGRYRRLQSAHNRKKAELKRGKDRAARIEAQISALQSVLSMLKTELQAAA